MRATVSVPRACPPAGIAEVQAFAAEKCPGSADARTAAGRFVNHFASNGWRVGGKARMVDWRAAFRNWMGRQAEFPPPRPSAGQAASTYRRGTKILENNTVKY